MPVLILVDVSDPVMPVLRRAWVSRPLMPRSRGSGVTMSVVAGDEIAIKTGRASFKVTGRLGHSGTARGTAVARLVERDGDKVICDSYGKRRWKAKRMRR